MAGRVRPEGERERSHGRACAAGPRGASGFGDGDGDGGDVCARERARTYVGEKSAYATTEPALRSGSWEKQEAKQVRVRRGFLSIRPYDCDHCMNECVQTSTPPGRAIPNQRRAYMRSNVWAPENPRLEKGTEGWLRGHR